LQLITSEFFANFRALLHSPNAIKNWKRKSFFNVVFAEKDKFGVFHPKDEGKKQQ